MHYQYTKAGVTPKVKMTVTAAEQAPGGDILV
jgi:hypothetical protein